MMPHVITPSEMLKLLPPEVDASGWRPVPGEGSLRPELVLIKDAPHAAEHKAGKPLMGKDGIPVRRALQDAGVDFYATCAFPFYRDGAPLKAAEARLAAGVLAEELRRLAPKRVLMLGANAARWTGAFAHPFKNVREVAGRNITVGETVFRVGPAPAAIAFSPAVYADFVRTLRELMHPESVEYPDAPERESYLTFTNRLQADRILRGLPQRLAVDVEATGTDPFADTVLTLQVSPAEGVGYAFPFDLFTPQQWGEYLGGKSCVFQHGSYDAKILARHGLMLRVSEDTLLMHSLLDETPGTHSMEALAPKYLGVEKWGAMVDYERMADVPLADLGRYGARDADITLRLANRFKPFTEGRPIHAVLHNAQNAVIRAELRGVRVDRDAAERMLQEVEGHLHDKAAYLADAYDLVNANSPAQVAKLLYDTLGLPVQKKKGRVTTEEDAILPLAEHAPVIRDVLEYRHLAKVRGTYLANILSQSARDGRYHPQFNLAGTETGRLTESLILLIPRPDELTDPDLGERYRVRLRELFLPDEGHLLIGADFRGLEVGMAGFLSGDAQLVHDYNTRLDTHAVVAIDAFNLPIAIEPRDTLKARTRAHHDLERTHAKSGTFAWLYGGDANTIRRNLKVERDVAERILAALVGRYQGVARYQEATKQHIKNHGSVSTPWGRTRRFVMRGPNPDVIEAQLREGINCTNQGMSSDMTLAAFTRLEALGHQMLFPLHDATYSQALEDDAERAAARVKDVMENVLPGAVAWDVDVKLGASWAAL